ncbi:MAG: hypothetical protein ACLP9C_04045 [Acidimicrobiales bacterium]
MVKGERPKAPSAEELVEAEDLRQTIKDIETQIAQAEAGSSSREFREDLGILLQEAQARLNELIPPATK